MALLVAKVILVSIGLLFSLLHPPNASVVSTPFAQPEVIVNSSGIGVLVAPIVTVNTYSRKSSDVDLHTVGLLKTYRSNRGGR